MTTVNELLEDRLHRRDGARRAVSIFVALAVHGGLAATAAFGPAWFEEEHLPIEYVPVRLVPPPPLGQSTPLVQENRPPEPAPVPEPVPEEPPVALADQELERPPVEPPPPRPEPPPPRAGSPTGHPNTTGTFGSAVTLDNPDFTYGYYVDRMVAVIREHWRRPSLGGTVEAVVSFRVHRDGRVTIVKIASSSGYSGYDLAAIRAVQSAAPLPPLPQGYKESNLGVHLIFR